MAQDRHVRIQQTLRAIRAVEWQARLYVHLRRVAVEFDAKSEIDRCDQIIAKLDKDREELRLILSELDDDWQDASALVTDLGGEHR